MDDRTSTQTQRTTFRIMRDDGDVMETGFTTPEEAHKRLRHMYDPGEYEVRAWVEWVDAEPLPLYLPPSWWARLVAFVWRRPQPEWSAVETAENRGERTGPTRRARWWRTVFGQRTV